MVGRMNQHAARLRAADCGMGRADGGVGRQWGEFALGERHQSKQRWVARTNRLDRKHA